MGMKLCNTLESSQSFEFVKDSWTV
jgi:hypothetical protein